MILVESAIKLATSHGLKAEIQKHILAVWKTDPKTGKPVDLFCTMITDNMVSEIQLQRFINEHTKGG